MFRGLTEFGRSLVQSSPPCKLWKTVVVTYQTVARTLTHSPTLADAQGLPIPQYTPPVAPGGSSGYTHFQKLAIRSKSTLALLLFTRISIRFDIRPDLMWFLQFDWIGVGNSGSTTGAEENGGVFSAGTYDYTIWDTYGDSLNGGAGIYFETRAAGSTGAWTTVQSETGYIGSSGKQAR